MDAAVTDNAERGRYEIAIDGRIAGTIEYRGRGAVRTFRHTEVAPEFAGRGVGTELIRRSLDDARAHGLHVVPVCPFVRAFLHEHRDYLDLVESRHRRAFGLPL